MAQINGRFLLVLDVLFDEIRSPDGALGISEKFWFLI